MGGNWPGRVEGDGESEGRWTKEGVRGREREEENAWLDV